MAVPKKKVSSARRDKRRSNNSKLTMPGLVKCSNPACGEMLKPHLQEALQTRADDMEGEEEDQPHDADEGGDRRPFSR